MAIDEHREDWTEEVLERVAEAQGEYQRTVEEVSSASQEVLAKIALLRFVRLFPEDEISCIASAGRTSWAFALER